MEIHLQQHCPKSPSIRPIAIGVQVFNSLCTFSPDTRTLAVLGSTSSGVFLDTGLSRSLVFLSYGAYRNPMSISLGNRTYRFPLLKVGERINLLENRLQFLSIGLDVDLPGHLVWQPGQPSDTALPLVERLPAAAALVQELLAGNSSPFASAAQTLLRAGAPYAPRGSLLQLVDRAAALLRTGNPLQAAAAVEPLLGFGRGLTPSGDDLLIGFMLVLNRWPVIFPFSDEQIYDFSCSLCQRAKSSTTRLSTQLLNLAAQGSADERLITAVDGMISGSCPAARCAELLGTWGASSGFESALGMLLAVSLSTENLEKSLPTAELVRSL